MDANWCRRVEAWMRECVGENETDLAVARWDVHSAKPELVVTFFGAYDTGKSSLVRRILAENNIPSPSWLTVSARHETHTANSIQCGNVRLQDTPGIGQGADETIKTNTQKALEAVKESDLLIVTLPPQLMTSEKKVLQSVLEDWAQECIAFVIGRFDDAGADPEDDAAGYEQRRLTKTAELRAALGLTAGVPIFVVAADPFGLHAQDSAIDSSTWIDSKQWDGITGLNEWIQDQALHAMMIRAEGERRFWFVRLADQMLSLTEQLDNATALFAEADKAAARRDTHERQLESLANGARARLDVVVSTWVDIAAKKWVPDQDIESQAFVAALGDWYDEQMSKLNVMVEEFIEEQAAQRQRPVIKVIFDLNFEERTTDNWAPTIRKFTPQLQKVCEAVRKAGSVASGTSSKSRSVLADAGRKSFLGKSGAAFAIAEGLIAPAGELFAMFAEEASRIQADQDRAKRREELREQIDKGCAEAANLIYQDWVDGYRQVLEDVGAYFQALANSATDFAEERDRLSHLLQSGEQLMQSRPGTVQHTEAPL